jgi:hypothetical protein
MNWRVVEDDGRSAQHLVAAGEANRTCAVICCLENFSIAISGGADPHRARADSLHCVEFTAGRAPGAALIRPEHVILKRAADDQVGDTTVNRFGERIVQVALLGEATECIVQVGGVGIVVRLGSQYNGACS